MKKIIAIASFLTALSSTSALAKTEGSYLGFDLHKASTEVTGLNTNGLHGAAEPKENKYTNSKTGVGINYKYAVNFGNKVFLAPEIFYERIGTKSTDVANPDNGAVSPGQDFFGSISVKNRYGAKLNLGYDLTDSFAVYASAGLAHTRYKLVTVSGNSVSDNTSGKTGVMYGVGMISHINDQISLGAEYNTQSFQVQEHITDGHVKLAIDIYKVTLAYHF